MQISPARVPIWLGAVVAVLALGVVWAHSLAGDDQYATRSDAPLFLGVASDPLGDGSTIVKASVNGAAYRYGRIAYPLAGWLLAFGRKGLLRASLAVVFAVSLGATVAVAAELLRRCGAKMWLALLVLATPFMWLWVATPVLVADPLVTALILGCFLAAERGRRRPMLALAALVPLARESAVLALLPVAAGDFRRDAGRAAATWTAVLAPYAAWSVWVRVRIGTWAVLDPAPSRRGAIGWPFAGALDTLRGSLDNGQSASLAMMLLTLLLAAWVAWRVEWWPVVPGALALAALVPCYGPTVLTFPGECARVFFVPQVALLLAAAGHARAGTRSGTLSRPSFLGGVGARGSARTGA